MSSEEKIKALEERIVVLEKAEQKRKVKRIIGIVWDLIKLGVFIAILVMAYNFIKPYKEKIDTVSEKVEEVEKFVNDKLGGFSKYFK
ncbi:MAG: hypothetical protein IKI04_02965 [Bacilli bacterium]|nr:hypothetical protein [Bacilli bacterium]